MRVEVARERASDAASAPERVGHEPAVGGQLAGRNQRPRATRRDQHTGVARGWWVERGGGQLPLDTQFVERAPQDAADAARRGKSALDGDAPFDDEIGTHERQTRVVEQSVQQFARVRERDVRDDTERFIGKRDVERVACDDVDVGPTTAQARGEPRVELDRDDAPGDARQLGRQPAGARTDVDDEVAGRDVRAGDDRRGERTAAKEVTATRKGRPRWCATTCHG